MWLWLVVTLNVKKCLIIIVTVDNDKIYNKFYSKSSYIQKKCPLLTRSLIHRQSPQRNWTPHYIHSKEEAAFEINSIQSRIAFLSLLSSRVWFQWNWAKELRTSVAGGYTQLGFGDERNFRCSNFFEHERRHSNCFPSWNRFEDFFFPVQQDIKKNGRERARKTSYLYYSLFTVKPMCLALRSFDGWNGRSPYVWLHLLSK